MTNPLLSMQATNVIKIYIDGEETPSIEFNVLLGHGIGCNGSVEPGHTPWNTKHLGHQATGGGLYNTYRIPFSSSAKVTATALKRRYITITSCKNQKLKRLIVCTCKPF